MAVLSSSWNLDALRAPTTGFDPGDLPLVVLLLVVLALLLDGLLLLPLLLLLAFATELGLAPAPLA
jgi:hypothetical protein